MDKQELRSRFLALRRALGVEERRKADAAICRNIRELACYRESICVAAYASDGREPDLFGLFGEKRFFLPRYVAAKGCYELVEIHDFTRDLIPASQVIIILMMYLGRIGTMSFAYSFFEKRNVPAIQNPVEKVMVG